MSEDAKSRMEQMLREAAPILKQQDRAVAVPAHVLAKLQAAKEKKFPAIQILTTKEMEPLLLKVLAKRSMDGVELILGLEKAHIQLKEASEGVLYGLLSKLESAGHLQTEWREQGGRMMKIYRVTEAGRGLLQTSQADATQMDAWSAKILAFDSTGA